MNLLVDVGVGQGVETCLREEGHDVLAIRDIDPRMDDYDILALAVQDQRLVLTIDKDFGDLVYHSGRPHAGVLLLRVEAARLEEKIRIVREILAQHGDKLSGRFSVYSSGRLRIR